MRCGGHSNPRTHRPSNGLAGAELIYAIEKQVKKYENTNQLQVIYQSRVTKLIQK